MLNYVDLVVRGTVVQHRVSYNTHTHAKWRECVVKLETMLEHWDASGFQVLAQGRQAEFATFPVGSDLRMN